MNNRTLSLTLLAAMGSISYPLMAQTPPAAKTSDEVVTLEKLDVSGVAIEENIMPTSRPFGSVYGDDRSILDTPRNVTIISREQLDAISIQDVRDFSKLTSSSYTTTNFGAPANPTIRGQYADLFQNGVRRVVTSNGNGLPLNFNSVESVNIIKGPATVVQGPSFYVGGAADLITKRPTFDTTKGSVTATIGSFQQRRWTADLNVPVSEKTATRFSYSGEDSESFYENGHKRTQALYGALIFKPTDKYELFLNSEVFYGDYVENFGINRVTQDLIDNGTYITGINNNPAGFFSGIPSGPAGPTVPGDLQNAANIVSGFPGTNRIVPTGTTDLSRRTRLIKPGDNSLGRMANLQAIQTFKVKPDFDIVNNSYFNYIKRDTISSYYYSEIVDPAWSIENRTEFRIKTEKHTINTGLALRYQEVTAYNHFFFEPASAWDLSLPRSGIDSTLSNNFPGFGAFPVPGYPGRFAVAGTVEGDTNDSSLFTAGLFFQDSVKVTDKLTLDLGARGDLLQAKSEDPFAPQLPGFLLPAAEYDDSSILGNANGSATYALTEKLKAYLTFNYSQNYGGAVGNGGGIKPNSGENDFTQPSKLWELGAKQSMLDGKLFLSGAAFHQTRIATQLDGSTRNFTYQGIEVELNYQPNKNFYATLSYSYLDAVSDRPQFDVGNVAFYDGTGSVTDAANYAPHPDNVRFFQVDNGPGRYRIQGLPQNLWSALATYKWDSGFGLSSGLVVHTDINNNVAGTLVIPTQYTLDLTGFYEAKTWFAKLAVLNATNEENWSPPNYVYGNESILADLPIRFELTLGYKF
jgi:outer membrane receptor for monomeric catechols